MKTRFICLALGIILLSSGASTQWVQTNGPYGGEVLCFTETSNGAGGADVFAGSFYGGVFRSTDDGATWIFSGLPNRGIGGLAAIDTNVFAGTYGGGVFRSSDNGTSWTAINEGLGGDLWIRTLAAFDDNLFAGTGSGVFRSTDQGTRWTTINSGMPYPSASAFALLGTNVFAGNSEGVYRSTNNGTHWTMVCDTGITALTAGGTNLFAGAFWGNYGVLLSTDTGVSWSSASSGLPPYPVWALSAVPDGSGGTRLLAGTLGVFLSSDEGTSWAPADPEVAATVLAFGVSPTGARILAGTSGGVIRSNDYGSSWTASNSGLINSEVRVLAVNPAAGSTGEDYLFSGTYQGGIFVSSNGGTSWTDANIGLPSGPAHPASGLAVMSVAGGNALVFAGVYDGGVFRSTDNGTSWTGANAGLTNLLVEALAVSSAAGASAASLFAGTWGGAYRSTDNGMSWSRVIAGGIIAAFAVDPTVTDGNQVFAGGLGSSGGGPGRAFFSSNNGTSWSDVSSGLPYGAVMALALGPERGGGLNVFAGVWGGGVYRSSNNGASWTSVNSGLTDSYIKALLAIPDEAGGSHLFVGTNSQEPGTGAGVFFSDDNGNSWIPVNSGLANLDISALALSPNGPGGKHLVAGTRYAGAWRRPLSEMITSIEPETRDLPNEFSLEQNYPNPFNPSTTIRYELPQTSHVTLSVYDMLGREVAMLLNEEKSAGAYTFQWDASALCSGVYFYRLSVSPRGTRRDLVPTNGRDGKAGSFTETKRLLLLK